MATIPSNLPDLLLPASPQLQAGDLLHRLLHTAPVVRQDAGEQGHQLGSPANQQFTSTVPNPLRTQDTEMLRLQALLLAPDRRQIMALEAQVAILTDQLQRREALLALLTPMISSAIGQCVRESRDEMAEALYPVIGKSVVRAVNEAMRDLARSIDTTMRRSLQPQILRQLGLRLRGLDPRTAALRDALPFSVHEVFLIHRTSGLLIQHLSAADQLPDADLIGGMLAAIRSYVQESFGGTNAGSLDSISYGDLQIIIEEGSAVLLAVVAEGVEPTGFQQTLRQQVSELHTMYAAQLKAFNGDPIDPDQIIPFLQPLIEVAHASA